VHLFCNHTIWVSM